MQQYVILLTSVILGGLAQLAMKKGMMGEAPGGGFSLVAIITKVFTSPYVFLGLALYGLSAILWLYVLSKIELSYAYPLVSISYIVVLLGSYFLFQETISWPRLLGIACICLGVIFISRS